jgi:hypothetical protein
MKQTLIAFWSLMVLSLPTTVTAQVSSLVAGNTTFALNLYSQLATTISWPYPSTPWTLQQSPDMNPTNWTQAQVGGSPVISNDGTNYYYSITPSPGNSFFRLSQQ